MSVTMQISLTEKAEERLKEIIAKKGENLALRVLVRAGGCSGFEYGMALERTPRPDDLKLEQNGVQIVIDPNSAEFLNGAVIDFVDSLMGGGFSVKNPNAVASCGCGHSFRTADKAGTPSQCGSCG
jgi:iron-sulfur cluster assembly protein